jgi:aspartyl/asparaginyl beta-hydroxylase (cupin superfamily)
MNDFNMKEKIKSLKQWSLDNNIPEDNLKKVFEMLYLGKRSDRTESDPIQFPACYIKDEEASAWRNAKKYSWVSLLEENFLEIKKEALSVFEEELMNTHPENDDLAGYGTWNTFFFYKNGEKILKNHQRCPLTSKVLSQINGVDIAGRTYFSAMTPGIHIKPHCGPHNFKLRTHLGLVTPQEAVIRVGDVTKPWPEGECIVFDDSFEHEVWNRSNRTRIVMIVDVWNPILKPEEIKALKYIMNEFYNKSFETINA